MRIAVAGTHCSGKSTLIEDFAAAHPEYVIEPEPYVWMPETFAGEPTDDDFHRQLELSVERLRGYPRGANVIAERSPLDFVAYLLAMSGDGVDAAEELAARGMEHVDLLVFLPLNDVDGIFAPEEEDLDLRQAMNDQLIELVDGLEGIRVVELSGSPRQRLQALERTLNCHQ